MVNGLKPSENPAIMEADLTKIESPVELKNANGKVVKGENERTS